MGLMAGLNSPFIFQNEVVEEKTELNFENEDSAEQKELADQDLISAKALLDVAEKSDDIKVKKACDKKATQGAMEAVEKYQKAVVYADENCTKIEDKKLHNSLEKTHNHRFQQRETKKAGINILEEEDINVLEQGVKRKKNKEKNEKKESAYNGVRFTRQDTAHEDAKKAVAVAEKAKNNLEKMENEQKQAKIEIGDVVVTFDS